MEKKNSAKIALEVFTNTAWFLAFFGFFVGLKFFLEFSFVGGLIGGLFCALPGLLCVVIAEIYDIQKQKLSLIEEQTQILKHIEEKLK